MTAALRAVLRAMENVQNLDCLLLDAVRDDYNFCRIHQTLRVTPAMEAGIADHVWNIEELVGLLDRMQTEAAA